MARVAELTTAQRDRIARMTAKTPNEAEIGELHALRLSVVNAADLRAIETALQAAQDAS
jgi:hypothetical protein